MSKSTSSWAEIALKWDTMTFKDREKLILQDSIPKEYRAQIWLKMLGTRPEPLDLNTDSSNESFALIDIDTPRFLGNQDLFKATMYTITNKTDIKYCSNPFFPLLRFLLESCSAEEASAILISLYGKEPFRLHIQTGGQCLLPILEHILLNYVSHDQKVKNDLLQWSNILCSSPFSPFMFFEMFSSEVGSSIIDMFLLYGYRALFSLFRQILVSHLNEILDQFKVPGSTPFNFNSDIELQKHIIKETKINLISLKEFQKIIKSAGNLGRFFV
ncbi:hypothetical protein M9Y10_007280 [Tritrichomonas musculus]|uniref:Rab-GAP TBC domain-containing protein n=1 Tax=Tritrichomonas musculus TaxID=1915356 RepID=A0ABR2J0V5_9EUKA